MTSPARRACAAAQGVRRRAGSAGRVGAATAGHVDCSVLGMGRRIADIMERDVVTLSPDMDLHEASVLLADRQISGAPVCARDGRLLGVLSVADLVEGCASSAGATRVGQLMTPAVLSVGADDAIQRAVETMAFEGVHRLVVVDDGRLVGIVTSMDVLRELAGYPHHDDRVIAVAPPEDAP